MNLIVLVPLLLVILGLAWGLWLIFRKGDMVTQPTKMIGYFIGAILAFLVAMLLTVVIVPAWTNQMLGLATNSSSVQGLQKKTQEILLDAVGQPAATVAPTVRPNPTISPLAQPSSNVQSSGVVYTVVRGDTLYSIARKYGVSPQNLQSLNKLASPDKIYAGQKLTIPKP
jgi:LysM repeat protein